MQNSASCARPSPAQVDRSMVERRSSRVRTMDWASVMYSFAALGFRPSEQFLDRQGVG